MSSSRGRRRLRRPVCTGRELAQAALGLLEANWRFPSPVRALTVTALNLSHGAAEQLSLFDEGAPARSDKRERLEKSLDASAASTGARHRGRQRAAQRSRPRDAFHRRPPRTAESEYIQQQDKER